MDFKNLILAVNPFPLFLSPFLSFLSPVDFLYLRWMGPIFDLVLRCLDLEPERQVTLLKLVGMGT